MIFWSIFGTITYPTDIFCFHESIFQWYQSKVRKAILEAEIEAKAKAEEKARLEAEAKAEEKARLEAEATEKAEAEEKAKEKAEAKAEAENKAEAEAEHVAEPEAEAKDKVEKWSGYSKKSVLLGITTDSVQGRHMGLRPERPRSYLDFEK